MGKKRWTRNQKVLQNLLREMRKKAGITQVNLAKALGHSQNYVSKAELGEKRLDLHELDDFCKACKRDLLWFVAEYQKRVSG